MNYLSNQEFLQIALELEEHHSVFHFLWKMGRPIFSSDCQKAAVQKRGQDLLFLLNKEYWEKSFFIKKKFIICHELLHVILKHHDRSKNISSKEELRIANHAMDIVNNHLLIDSFGFKREEVDPENELCWYDTVFDKEVIHGKSYEYYFDLLKKQGLTDDRLLDDHDFSEEIDLRFPSGIHSDDLNSFKSTCDSKIIIKPISNKTKNLLWPKPFAALLKSKIKAQDENSADHWASNNRRLFGWNSELSLPSEINEDQTKPEVVIFIDASYSCFGLTENFLQLSNSLPRNKFKVRIFTFGGIVNEIFGTVNHLEFMAEGNTYFHILEKELQKFKYPDLVCVFTDGQGDEINPQYPERWHWFLSHRYFKLIPKKSFHYVIEELL